MMELAKMQTKIRAYEQNEKKNIGHITYPIIIKFD